MHDAWRLVYEGFDPETEGLREALCALGNGRFVTRGAGEESHADEVHYPGTYRAGLYNRLESEVAGRTVENEDLVNLPNWLPLTFRAGEGAWFDAQAWTIHEVRQELNLKSGVLRRWATAEDADGRQVRVAWTRLVSMATPHLAAIRLEIVPVNWNGELELRSGIDGEVRNAGVARYRALRGDHLRVGEARAGEDGRLWVSAQTEPSGQRLAMAARMRMSNERGAEIAAAWADVSQSGRAAAVAQVSVRAGCMIRLDKIVAMRTVRDPGVGDCLHDAKQDLDAPPDFDAMLQAHAEAWEHLWNLFDVRVDVVPETDLRPYPFQLILRLHTFHLLQTVSLHSIGDDAGVPARGLHGEAYRGHVFWDEMFILPFYTAREPAIARSLLGYRIRRLDAARSNAAAEGFAGAMFPWQSGSNGREETQLIHLNPKSGTWDPDRSRLQRHGNAAVALSLWRYAEAAGDSEFLRLCGTEALAEIARFWRSQLEWNEASGCFEIHGVMGPDEFHEAYPGQAQGGLDNNAYTNLMAAWCLRQGADALSRLDARTRDALAGRIHLAPSEIAEWREAAERIYLPVTDGGRIEAFSGYEQLEEFDWEGYRRTYGAIGRLDRILKAEGRTPDEYKVSKQADLCMIFYVLDPEEREALLSSLGVSMSDDEARETMAYYRNRTSHGSTLSHLVFAAILEDEAEAWEHFVTAVRSDIDDIQGGTTPEGIHTAVMAGTVRQVTERYAGLRLRKGRLYIDPRLPEAINEVRCVIRLRGVPLLVRVERRVAEVEAPSGMYKDLDVVVRGTGYRLPPGARLRVNLEQDSATPSDPSGGRRNQAGANP